MLTINNLSLSGTIAAIPSKSDFHRALICAALSDTQTRIYYDGTLSTDIIATIGCLNSLGASISAEKSDCILINPIWGNLQTGSTLDCVESGSTLRFLMPVAAALGNPFTISGEGRLPARPMEPLLQEMKEHGCIITGDGLPLAVKGKLAPGKYRLSGNISSQYISGLLFALPLLDGDSEIVLTSTLESTPYVNMTISSLNKFGIQIKTTSSGFHIRGRQSYSSPGEYMIEGDWSNAAFWLAAGAMGINSEICCTGLSLTSLQADAEILTHLRRMGANIAIEKNCVCVSSSALNPITFNAKDAPDLVPITAILMTAAAGTSVIEKAGRLRIKESDRLTAISENIAALGGNITEHEDSLTIRGDGTLNGGNTSSFNDHRIAMAVAISSIICKTPVHLSDAQAVNKSYPDFFNDFKILGGDISGI